MHPARWGPSPHAHGPGPRRMLRWLGGALALLALGAAPAAAQQGEVSGIVVEGASQRPVSGAQVTVQGQNRGVVTDAQGRFRITGLQGRVTLQADRLGYGRATRAVNAGETGIVLTLAETALSLDAVVVTGTPGGTEVRRLGNAITSINAAQVVEDAPVNNVQQLLNGRAPGVVVQPASGAVGTGARIRIRGSGSFSLTSEPLIYVDGVRVNNTFATGPENQGFGSSSVSRLNDINPEDIESIEVIRGPAAATLYGTEASNGVIQIITRKGAAGRPQWNLSVKQGINYLQNPEGRFWTNWGVAGGDTVSLDIVEAEDGEGRPIFRNGRLQEYDLSLSGGTERVRYFLAGGMEDSKGAEASNDLRRYNARINLDLVPTDNLDINLSAGYVDGLTNLSAEAGFGGRVWSTVLATPTNLQTRRGFHSGTPEEYDRLYNFTDDVNRLTGSLRLTHRPFEWLTHRLSAGVDYTRSSGEIFMPRIDEYYDDPVINGVFGSEALGFLEITDRDIRYRTLDYSATGELQLRPGLMSSTALGAQYYSNSLSRLYNTGSVFPVEGLSALSSTTQDRDTDDYFEENVTVGVFGQQQLGWNDRLFLTAGLRVDDNSAFGENFDLVYYPKVNASWVVSEEPFWGVPYLSTLKLRGAYGRSGQQPQVYSALRTYTTQVGRNDEGALIPEFLGNPDLGPERGEELELGFDAGFLEDRLGLELTWYDKRTRDAILERSVAPSAGYSGLQFFNAGEIRNWGVEALLRGRVLDRERLRWDVGVSLATNDNEVVDLGLGDATMVTAGTYLRHQEGYPVGGWWEQRVLGAEFNASGQVVNVTCDDGSGGSTLCYGADGRPNTADDAPDVYLGRSVPTLEGAFNTTLRLWDRVQLFAMVDFKRGHRKLDGNLRVRCTVFTRCRENFYPREFAPERIAQIQSSRNLVDFLIDDASFAKLREVSVAYTLSDRLARRAGATRATISLAGRNLHTWTNYEGLEPEAMFLGGTRGGNHGAWEQTVLPQLSQWVLSFNLGF
jgi:TonB-dependent SusC/RagA subfamily outer membrane receptor